MNELKLIDKDRLKELKQKFPTSTNDKDFELVRNRDLQKLFATATLFHTIANVFNHSWIPVHTFDPDTRREELEGRFQLFSPEFIDLDFNPEGIIDGYWQDCEGWRGASWDANNDEWSGGRCSPTHVRRYSPGPMEYLEPRPTDEDNMRVGIDFMGVELAVDHEGNLRVFRNGKVWTDWNSSFLIVKLIEKITALQMDLFALQLQGIDLTHISKGDRRSKDFQYQCIKHERRSTPSDLLGQKHFHKRADDKGDKPYETHRRLTDPPIDPYRNREAALTPELLDALLTNPPPYHKCKFCGKEESLDDEGDSNDH